SSGNFSGSWRATFKPLLASPLQRRDRAHFDQELLAYQAVDDQERVRRISGALEQFGKFARAIGHELGDVLRMHEIGREFDEIGGAWALRGRSRADGGGAARAWPVGIRRRPVGCVGAGLAGDEQKFRRRLGAGWLRILSQRLAEAVRVENLDIGPQSGSRAV